jgi:hypothetical protein
LDPLRKNEGGRHNTRTRHEQNKNTTQHGFG